MSEVLIYRISGHKRSTVVCEAMERGIRRIGDKAVIVESTAYRKGQAETFVFYGMVGTLARAIRETAALGGKAIYIDLGYWGRHHGGRWCGYHKLAINSRHPTAHFQRRKHDGGRFKLFGLTIQPWRASGRHILLAGMSGKAAPIDGFNAHQWERLALKEIKRHTDRPIVYRPKPSWKGAHDLPGTIHSPKTQPLEEVLADCHAVVTHHSNVAVDGLIAGIPTFCLEGVAAPMSRQTIEGIEDPLLPCGRKEWAADVAWTQFSIPEMASGLAWRHLKNEGLVP